MSKVKLHIAEIEKTLQHYALGIDQAHRNKLQKYIGTKFLTYGLTSKVQNEICKNGFSFYSNNNEDTFKLFDAVFHHSPSFEGKQMAFLYLEKNYKKISHSLQLELLPHWVVCIDNWALSDNLSKYLTRLLEMTETKKDFLEIIRNWNASDNLWERRQSLICLHYYSRTKNEFVEYKVSEKLIQNLLLDKEYFVQKAVGWALRESFNIYPELTFKFIDKNIKQITSTAFTTCIEKMNDNQKQILKQKRKK